MNKVKALFFTATLALAMLAASGAAAARHDDAKFWKVEVEPVTAPLVEGSSGSGDLGDGLSGDSSGSGAGSDVLEAPATSAEGWDAGTLLDGFDSGSSYVSDGVSWE